MERFRVVGGTSLRGEVPVVGAKNSALKLMAAALLAVGRTRLSNVPAIVDVTIMAELLRRLGCTVDYDAAAGVVEIDVPEKIGHRADYDLVRALRASISVLGPLVARCGEADVAVPGGDAIGSRGLDLHAAGLETLGATVHVTHGYLIAEAPHGLHGGDIRLDFPSVGATENVLSAAVLARGRTRLSTTPPGSRRSSTSPRCSSRWARGSPAPAPRVIEVEGVDGAVARPTTRSSRTGSPRARGRSPRPRRAATSRSCGGVADHLSVVLDALVHAGAHVETTGRGFRVSAGGRRLSSFDVATLPYPGFPTDLQPFALAYNAVAEGSAMITENLFEARFRTVQELARLGADARVDGHHVMVHGVEPPLRRAGRGQRHPGRRRAGHRRPGRRRDHDRQRRAPRRPRLRRLRRGDAGPRSRRHPRAGRRAVRLSRLARLARRVRIVTRRWPPAGPRWA